MQVFWPIKSGLQQTGIAQAVESAETFQHGCMEGMTVRGINPDRIGHFASSRSALRKRCIKLSAISIFSLKPGAVEHSAAKQRGAPFQTRGAQTLFRLARAAGAAVQASAPHVLRLLRSRPSPKWAAPRNPLLFRRQPAPRSNRHRQACQVSRPTREAWRGERP